MIAGGEAALDPIVSVLVGLALLAVGGESLVRGAVGAARALGVSPLLIGLTLVGFGTSTPELVTSLQAAARGSPGLAVGNVVGSNIANILLILGVAALIRPIRFDPRAFSRDGVALALATLACLAAVLFGRLTPWIGAGFLAALVVYLVVSWLQERRAAPGDPEAMRLEAETEAVVPAHPKVLPGLGLAIVGILLTILGARVLVDGAIDVARAHGVSETMIGLTVVAVGTSLPELVASVAAALRGRADVAFGNVVGSNIYNILGILGITAVVSPLEVPPEIARVDVWVMVAAATLILAQRNFRLGRREALVLLTCYGLYVTALVAGA